MDDRNDGSAWLDMLRRQAGIRRAIVLHGELLDVCYDPKRASYVPVLDVVVRTLADRGFEHVFMWDRYSGVSNVSGETWRALARDATELEPAEDDGGEDYDIGPRRGQQDESMRLAPPSVDDFLSVAYHHLIAPKKRRIAVVVDWSQYLFGNAGALSEQERQWLLIVSKAIRNAPVPLDDIDQISRPTNVVTSVPDARRPPAYSLSEQSRNDGDRRPSPRQEGARSLRQGHH